jgi:serine-type D-Ala-D-Ala carboxypeptidase (penicillin-binding protein 5/6)
MCRLFLLILVLVAGAAAAQPPVPLPSIAARTWLLLDLQSQQVLAQRGGNERVEPASLTKLMTAYLVFDALRQKQIALDQPLRVSLTAWKMPGARMFTKADSEVRVDELLRGMIVVSANDAAVALAEGVAGTEEAFVEKMNAQARRFDLRATHFTNATGLPQPQHYSTAADLARLAAAVIRDFPTYLPYYQQRDFTYNDITQPNRNPLLGRDPRVDGLKTGYTENAGYCLIATAHSEDRRLLAVVTGAASEGARGIEAQKLLNHGFQHYETPRVYQRGATVAELPVWKGSDKHIKAGVDQDVYVSVPRGQAALLKASLTSQQPLLAPLGPGQPVGVLKITFDERPLGEYPVVALESVSVANLFVRAWDSLRLLFE